VGDVKGNVQTCTKCTTTWVEMSYADWKRTVATINGLRRIPSAGSMATRSATLATPTMPARRRAAGALRPGLSDEAIRG
jgi:hypothetical protein